MVLRSFSHAIGLVSSLILLGLYLPLPNCFGQQAPSESGTSEPMVELAAEVAGQKISVASAKSMLNSVMPGVASESPNSELLNLCLNQIVNRYVIYDYLESKGQAAGKSELRLAMDELEKELAKFDKSVESFAAENERYRAELEFDASWQIAWNRFLKKKLTDKYLQAFFERHSRQFDGTKVKVAHILFKSNQNADSEKAKVAAEDVRSQISAGSLSWDEAVEKYSDAPTKNSGGELGWIEIDKPMPPEFTRAAFTLDLGECSPPVQTSVGIHLIRCLEIEPGKIRWRDALEEIRRVAATEEFYRMVKLHRPKISIQFSPGFRELKLENVESLFSSELATVK